MHLTRATIKASFWLTSYNMISKFTGLVKTIILARILTPAQFGYWGFVSLALNLIETFTETGVEGALIQKKQVSRSELSAGWTIFLVRSIIISIILFLSAPFVAWFFHSSQIVPYIQFISITPILRALRNPALVFIKKRLEFHKEFVFLTVGSLAEIASAIIITIVTKDIWGIVISIAVGATAEIITSYIVVKPVWPTKFALSEAIPLINFGKWLWGSSILAYIIDQGDDIIVGRLLGAAPLGFYQNAYKVASLPATQITGVVTKVTFPAFSMIQDDKKRLFRAFKKTFWLTTGITLFASIIIAVFAHPLVKIILGDQWLPIVPTLRILCVYGAIRACSSTYGALINALGKPHFGTISQLVKAASMFLIIFPLTIKYGINGTSWATVISSVFAFVIFMVVIRKAIQHENSSH